MNKINQTLRKARDFHKNCLVQNYGVRRCATMEKIIALLQFTFPPMFSGFDEGKC